MNQKMRKKAVGFGERLRKLRIAKGQTQQEAANSIKTTRVMWNRYEKKNAIPSGENLAAISASYNVSINYLLYGI